MGDFFTIYENGLKRLLELLGKNHPDYNKALTFQSRLSENIKKTQLFGDTRDWSSERAEIIYALNEFTIPLIGQSFSELCEIPDPPLDNFTSEAVPDDSPNYAETLLSDCGLDEELHLPELPVDFLILACKYINSIQNEVLQAYKVFSPEGGDIWPYQCTKIITAFQKWKKPLLPNNLPLGSLEVKLSYVHEQTHICIQLINDFSPYGLQQLERAMNKRRIIRQRLDELVAECNTTIILINASDESTPSIRKCI